MSDPIGVGGSADRRAAARAGGAAPHPARALTIAGSDSGGGAGVQADLATFHAHGVHGLTALSALTAQNSVGVHRVHPVPPDMVTDQIAAVAGDIGVDAVKTGMLGSAAVVEAVADAVARLVRAPLVVDPVAVSKHGDPLLDPQAVHVLIERLLPLADLVTPNLGEVELLTGVRVTDRADLPRAAAAMLDLGPRWVLVKGGHLPGREPAVDLLTDGEHRWELIAPRAPTRHTHGTGCTLSAAITARLARGDDLPTAARAGKRYVTAAIVHGYPLGAGIGPVGHLWWVPSPAPEDAAADGRRHPPEREHSASH